MKKILSVLLAVCLLCSLTVPASAAIPGLNDVETPEAFLNRLVSSTINSYDCEKLDGTDPAYLDYGMVLQHSMFSTLSGLHLETYGMKTVVDKKLWKEKLSYEDARWLCENILNWPEGAWEDMLQTAQKNKGYLGPYKYVLVKDGYVAGEAVAGVAFGTGIKVVARRQSGSRLDMVFDYYRGSHSNEEPPTYGGRFYAELEQKTISGKKYWTVYRIKGVGNSENPLAVGGFDDVVSTDFYADPVLWAVSSGITQGSSSNRFNPTGTCTRGQIVTFLWRAAGEPVVSGKTFSDVPAGAYYEKAVKWAVENNVTSGMSASTFAPDRPCTRAEAVTFLWRAAGKPDFSRGGPFTDIASGAFYSDAVQWAVENGITTGTGNGKFSPGDACTRGQIVTFLYRDKK